MLVLVVVLAGAGVAVAVWPRAHDAVASGGCAKTVEIPVITAPSIARPLTNVVTAWNRTKPTADGSCVRATVISRPSDVAEQVLAHTATPSPTIWVPESSVWPSRLANDSPDLSAHINAGRPVATSPLVIATTPGRAGALAPLAKQGWAATVLGPQPIAIPDPIRTTEGAVAMAGFGSQLGYSRDAPITLAGVSVHLSQHVLPSVAAGLDDLKARPGSAPAFITSEQQVILANQGQPAPVAAAVYPSGPAPTLNYPYVRITPEGTQPSFISASAVLSLQIQAAGAAGTFAAVGLRNPNGDPLGGQSQPGAPSLTSLPSATPGAVLGATRVWNAATLPVSLLAVIDVSGSMNDDDGHGRSKISVAAAAAGDAVRIFPDNWSVGIWAFSSKPPPQPDWTELAPIGPVAQSRDALLAATQQLPQHVGGNTGLYETMQAAFDQVTANYVPGKVNSIVLMTDGGNVDVDGPDLPTLVAKLKQEFNPKKPIEVITIALGKDADVAALQAISKAVSGVTYIVRNPEDVRGVLLRTIVRRS